jgi:hypothetical protein
MPHVNLKMAKNSVENFVYYILEYALSSLVNDVLSASAC